MAGQSPSQSAPEPDPRNGESGDTFPIHAPTPRRARKQGIRPLKLHCARHTWATLALHAGKSIRWVADQLGHADPGFTLRVYAHAMRDEESDLSFAEFGGSKRLYPAPTQDVETENSRNYLKTLARREGFASERSSRWQPSEAWPQPPTLRFESCGTNRVRDQNETRNCGRLFHDLCQGAH